MVSEVKVWWTLRADIDWNPATRRSTLICGMVLAMLLLPWRSDVRAPAVMGATQAQGLYAVNAARVVSAPLVAGTAVQTGQILVQLESPELRFHLAQEQTRERLLYWELEQQPFNQDLQKEGSALRERWIEAAESVKGLQQQVDQLIVRAPFAGHIAEVDDSLVPGAWVAHKEKLFEILGPQGAKAEALVDERDLGALQIGASATFIADTADQSSMTCRIEAIDRVNLVNLESAYLVSTYGGPIPVQKDRQGALVPTQAWYRVRLENCGQGKVAPARELRGVAHLRGEWHSIAGRYLRRAVAIVQREMGF